MEPLEGAWAPLQLQTAPEWGVGGFCGDGGRSMWKRFYSERLSSSPS